MDFVEKDSAEIITVMREEVNFLKGMVKNYQDLANAYKLALDHSREAESRLRYPDTTGQ